MDNELFEEKYALYSKLIFKLSMTYLGNKSDAEDITQEVFIKLFTNPQQFDNLQHERYWIIRVTINMCKNHLNTFWNKNILPIDTILDNSVEDNNNEITEMLFNLAPKYRMVLYLYYYERYSIDEIAKSLNLTKSGVKMRLKRGREKLKLDLEDDGYAEKGLYPCNR